MIGATHGKQLVVSGENRIGLLLDLSKLLSEKGIGILAIQGDVAGSDCHIRLVTDDNLRSQEALAEQGRAVREEDVILMELTHKPGMLKRVTEALANEKIDIHHLYATALDDQQKCLVVMHTSNDEHALPTLKKIKFT
jgi:hypothetical protein